MVADNRLVREGLTDHNIRFASIWIFARVAQRQTLKRCLIPR